MSRSRNRTFRCVALSASFIAAACAASVDRQEQSVVREGEQASVADSTLAELDVDTGVDMSEYEPTPGGFMTHKSCIHEVPDGAQVTEDRDGTMHVESRSGRRDIPRCPHPRFRRRAAHAETQRVITDPPPATEGFLVSSNTFAPANGSRNWFNGISGTWFVPQPPASTKNIGILIYIFNGLTSYDANPDQILQPVLQFGGTEGPTWKIAAYLATQGSQTALHSPFKAVHPTDTITGAIVGTNCTTGGACTWLVGMSGGGQTTNMVFTTATSKFTRADQAVLETQNSPFFSFDSCDQLPTTGFMQFSKTYLYQPPATGNQNSLVDMYNSTSWNPQVTQGIIPDCGYAVRNITRGAALFY